MSEGVRDTAPEREAAREARNAPETDAGVLERNVSLRSSPLAAAAASGPPASPRPAIARRALALQRTHGNAYVQRELRGAELLRRRPPTETIEFGEDEGSVVEGAVFNLGESGSTPISHMRGYVNGVKTILTSMRSAELGAINQFLTHMTFASSTDAQPDVLGAVFRQVGRELWGAAIGRIPGVGGLATSAILSVLTAGSDELERAAAAQSSYEVGRFITTLRSSTLSSYQARIIQLELEGLEQLDARFGQLDGSWTRGTSIVTGEKATFLTELEQHRRALLRAVPQPAVFQHALIRRWVTSRSAGGRGSSSEDFLSRVGNGRIRIKFNTAVSGGEYTYTHVSTKLYTSSNSGDAADMLTEAMDQRGKHVYELGVPVDVLLRTENLVGGRSYFRFGIRNAHDYDRTHWHEPAQRAWEHMSWDPIDSITRIDGG